MYNVKSVIPKNGFYFLLVSEDMPCEVHVSYFICCENIMYVVMNYICTYVYA